MVAKTLRKLKIHRLSESFNSYRIHQFFFLNKIFLIKIKIKIWEANNQKMEEIYHIT